MEQAAANLEAALHAAGEGADERLPPVPEADHLEHFPEAIGDDGARKAVELGVEAQVLLGGQVVVDRGVLEHQAEVAPHLVALAHHVVTGHDRRARGRPRERAEDVDGGGLAGAVRAEKPEGLAGENVEIEPAHGLEIPVALGEPAHVDGRGGGPVGGQHGGVHAPWDARRGWGVARRRSCHPVPQP